MSAEAAVQTATLVHNKVGASLAGVTSLLSPEQKSDVIAKLILNKTKELLIKNGVEKTRLED